MWGEKAKRENDEDKEEEKESLGETTMDENGRTEAKERERILLNSSLSMADSSWGSGFCAFVQRCSFLRRKMQRAFLSLWAYEALRR